MYFSESQLGQFCPKDQKIELIVKAGVDSDADL